MDKKNKYRSVCFSITNINAIPRSQRDGPARGKLPEKYRHP